MSDQISSLVQDLLGAFLQNGPIELADLCIAHDPFPINEYCRWQSDAAKALIDRAGAIVIG